MSSGAPRCCIQVSGAPAYFVTESFDEVMRLIDAAYEDADGDAGRLMTAPLIRVTGWSRFGTSPMALAVHDIIAVGGTVEEPGLPEVPDAPPEWLRDSLRRTDDEADAGGGA